MIHLEISKFKFNTKFLYISFLGMVLSGIFIGGLFYGLYNTSKESLINEWKNNTIRAASDIDFYLAAPIDAVELSSARVNEMLEANRPAEEALIYLKEETEVYSNLINGNKSGIYGYYKGEYIDGSGWEAEVDYDPTDRPWYKAALEANGRTVIVSPYLNLQTRTMMISISKLLNDGESVIAMDLFMVELQSLMQGMTVENGAENALILDREGIVVAHSDYLEVGKDYNVDGGETGKQLIESIVTAYNGTASLRDGKEKYVAFFDRCNNGWYTALIINEKDAFQSLRIIYFAAASALIIVMALVFIAFNYMGHKQNIVEHLGREMTAISDIYMSMILIDLETDMISVVRGDQKLAELLGGNYRHYSKRTDDFAEHISAEHFRKMTAAFFSTATLDERLKNVNTISYEFLDNAGKWMRMRYIVVKRNDKNKVTQVLMAVESIDDDKKKQEQLRILSETDRMTGIMNRGSGEQKIKEKLSVISGGMLCVIDVDKFKYVNDNFGHAVGDKVLIAIAKALKDTFRDSDIVFRLGGDEFAAFAVDVKDEVIGNKIVDRLFNKIAGIDVTELGDHKITVSMGAAFYNASEKEPFDVLYKRADKGTYQSKKNEGNTVTFIY